MSRIRSLDNIGSLHLKELIVASSIESVPMALIPVLFRCVMACVGMLQASSRFPSFFSFYKERQQLSCLPEECNEFLQERIARDAEECCTH